MIDFSSLQNLYNDQINMLLASNGLTTKCLLNYGITKKDICPNCVYDANLKKSANKYKTGGPKPFVDGRICPYCNGIGYHGIIKVEEAYFAVIWDYKYWINKPLNIQNPNGMIQTICDRTYLDKIKKCQDLTIVYTANNSNPLFKLAEEPNPVGLGDNNYLFCNWERTGISTITESMVEKPFVGLNIVNYANSSGNIMYSVGTVGGPSAYGTYDQNGNAEEWTGTRSGAGLPIQIKVAGGYSIVNSSGILNGGIYASNESGTDYRGFRIVAIENNDQNFPDNPDDINDFVLVQDKNNKADTNGYGSVGYDYYIGKYEITFTDWCDFINAKASYATSSGLPTDSDTYELISDVFLSGVDYTEPSGFPGNYIFTPISGYENLPITQVDFLDCLRYCNWLHNGAGSGSTETGAYNLNGSTSLSTFINPLSSAKYRLPTANEWYKSAFYKSGGITSLSCSVPNAGYWDYATQSDKLPSPYNP